MNKQGMRVIAVAHKSYHGQTCDFRYRGRERHGTDWVSGFLLDPPKQSAASAIKQLHEHGIEIRFCLATMMRIVRTIARQVGIRTDNALTGPFSKR